MVYLDVLLVTSLKSGLARHEAHVKKLIRTCTVVVGNPHDKTRLQM